MKVVLISRYPRVDTLAWKRTVAADLLAAGVGLSVLYSRASLIDQAAAGVREEGAGVLRRYRSLRRGRAGGSPAPSLAAWAAERGLHVERVSRLSDARLDAHEPDLAILLGADLVPAELLAAPRLGTINAHYGLLPAYRGMNVTEWSVLRGDPPGVTVHLVDAGVDTGPILLREEIALRPGDTFATLRERHQEVAARLLVRAALELRDGTARPTPQRAEEGRQYYRMHPALRRLAADRLHAQAAERTALTGARSG